MWAWMDRRIARDQTESLPENHPIQLLVYETDRHRNSLTNSCPLVAMLSMVGVRSNKSKKFRAADSDGPTRSVLRQKIEQIQDE